MNAPSRVGSPFTRAGVLRLLQPVPARRGKTWSSIFQQERPSEVTITGRRERKAGSRYLSSNVAGCSFT